MTTKIATKLNSLSHHPQRQMLLALLRHNPQDDTPSDHDLEFEDEMLETLFDLRHYHLPELETRGFIDYDRENHIITKGPNFEEIKPLLELIERHSDELPDDWS